jgi:glycosyltransferase involved in cell wall biosynthesis
VEAAPKISVIIPVYNSAKFLPNCLESVINQTFRDIEIICINDGSRDNSLALLQAYAKKDNRIKIFSQQNRGVSAARNVGLENAIGEYIAFVDSDDTIKPDMLQKLYKIIVDYQCDIALCDVANMSRRSDDVSGGNLVLVMDKYPRKPARNMLITACWNKLYKRSVIGDVKFNERVPVWEDLNFNLLVFFCSKKQVFLAEKLYIYSDANPDSLSKSSFFRAKIIKSFCIIIEDLYARIGNTLEEKDDLKENILNDLAMEMFCLTSQEVFSMLIAAQKISEFYRHGIIDLNMKTDLKMFAIAVIGLGKAINFVEGLRNAF